MTCLVYLLVASKPAPLRLCYLTSLTVSASTLPAWFRRRKYPSSYPDFRIRPFCTTTLTRPVKRSVCSSRSMDADSTSASCTLRRKSTNISSSVGASPLFMSPYLHTMSELSHPNFHYSFAQLWVKVCICFASRSLGISYLPAIPYSYKIFFAALLVGAGAHHSEAPPWIFTACRKICASSCCGGFATASSAACNWPVRPDSSSLIFPISCT